MCILIGGLWSAVALVRADRWSLFSPLPYFLLTCSLYFGVGALLPVLGSRVDAEYVTAFYPLSDENRARIALLNSLSIIGVLVGFLAASSIIARKDSLSLPKPSVRELWIWAYTFLAVGWAARLSASHMAGVGNVIFSLENFVVISLLLFAYLSSYRRQKLDYCLTGLVLVLEIVWSIGHLSKHGAALALVFTISGLSFWRRRPYLVFVGGFLVTFVFVFSLTPFIGLARDYQRISEERGVNLDWWEFGQQAFLKGELETPSALTRFCYSTGQAYCMDQFDAGVPGETYKLIPISIIPRMVWQQKPVITVGYSFNESVTGNPDSASAPGIFAELYWNGGWTLTLVTTLCLGVYFFIGHDLIFWIFTKGKYAWLPLMLNFVIQAVRPDDWFVSTFVSSLPVAVIQCLLCLGLQSLIAITAGSRING